MRSAISVWSVLEKATTILTLVAAAGVVWVLFHQQGKSSAVNASGLVSRLSAPIDTKANSSSIRVGHPKIAIVEFSDFQCPYCGQFARDVFPLIQRMLVSSGQVTYVFRNFPLDSIHSSAVTAAEAAECAADQHKYWEMHDWLFRHQRAFGEKDWLSEANIVDSSTLARCVAAQQALTKVTADRDEGLRLGVHATPTFLIGWVKEDGVTITVSRRVNGLASFETFKSTVDDVAKSKA